MLGQRQLQKWVNLTRKPTASNSNGRSEGANPQDEDRTIR
jgi:hypothetical protein